MTATMATLGVFLISTGTVSQADTPAARRVIEILCTRDGTTVLHDQGDAGPKGVTVRFRHQAGGWLFFYDGAPNNWTSWGSAMVAELQLPIPPGPARVQCLPNLPHASSNDPRWSVDVQVHDPRGLWREPRLNCGQAVGRAWHGDRVPPEREREVVREAFRLVGLELDEYELVLLGYPRQQPRLWGAERDGRVIGHVRMMEPNPDGTVTPNGSTACTD